MGENHTFVLKNGFNETTVVTKFVDGDELKVIKFLLAYSKLRIDQLVAGVANIGSHEIHEKPRKRTTTRKLYQVIRNLREAGYPIVGDSEGVWLAKTVQEVEEFAEHLEQKARSDIKSMLSLKRTMLANVQSQTPSLFDSVSL